MTCMGASQHAARFARTRRPGKSMVLKDLFEVLAPSRDAQLVFAINNGIEQPISSLLKKES
jgi:hypothetical protein